MYYFYDSYGNLTHLYYHVGSTKTAYNVLTNSQGDVIAIYNWDGTQLVASYSYDAWGNCTITQDTTGIGAINPIRYRGYYYDSEIGLYYLQSRYYDPNTGRFINSDGVLFANQGVLFANIFIYSFNNPIVYEDTSGYFPVPIAYKPLASIPLSDFLKEMKPVSVSFDNGNYIEGLQYAATVYAEAGGQNITSKRAVAHVINNRIGTANNRVTIIDVISEDSQFNGYGWKNKNFASAMVYYLTGICENEIDRKSMDECLMVVIPIYAGEEADFTNGATYFHSHENPSDWYYHDYYTQVYVPGTEDFWFYK